MTNRPDRPCGGPAAPAGARPHPAEPTEADQVDPAVLGTLLARHGWHRRGGTPGRYTRWTPPGAHTGTSLLVPDSRAFPDSGDLLAEALQALNRSAAPTARDILIALAVPSDEIRWWRDIPEGPAGAAAWPQEERLRHAAHRMLLAAALAVRIRAGYYGARHRTAAARELRPVLVEPATAGGPLTAFVPVDGGRHTAVRLHHALHAAREAADYQRATGGMEAFDTAVEAGVSHELTEALIALVHGTEGARVAVEWAPAAGVPAACAASCGPVEFSPGDLPVLREASERFRCDEPALPVRLTGTVERMRRSGPGSGGTVRLRVLAGAQVPHVRVVLDEEAYRIAGHAHLVGLPVRVNGRLESRGGFRRLTGASGVVPVQMEDAERDRMLKALQENVDFFEEACTGE